MVCWKMDHLSMIFLLKPPFSAGIVQPAMFMKLWDQRVRPSYSHHFTSEFHINAQSDPQSSTGDSRRYPIDIGSKKISASLAVFRMIYCSTNHDKTTFEIWKYIPSHTYHKCIMIFPSFPSYPWQVVFAPALLPLTSCLIPLNTDACHADVGMCQPKSND